MWLMGGVSFQQYELAQKFYYKPQHYFHNATANRSIILTLAIFTGSCLLVTYQ